LRNLHNAIKNTQPRTFVDVIVPCHDDERLAQDQDGVEQSTADTANTGHQNVTLLPDAIGAVTNRNHFNQKDAQHLLEHNQSHV
jgi:hypothetical protein